MASLFVSSNCPTSHCEMRLPQRFFSFLSGEYVLHVSVNELPKRDRRSALTQNSEHLLGCASLSTSTKTLLPHANY